MSQFYIDDSVHDETGFVIGACVYSNHDLSTQIADILIQSGYDSNISEFKSSANYRKEPQMAIVRDDLRQLFGDTCKFGIVVIPRNERGGLGFECLYGINEFIKHNGLTDPIDLYFDQGLFPSMEKANQAAKNLSLANCNFHFEQNSIAIRGLQLADMTAHTASIILKEKMGLITKMVKAGENSGYDPDLDMELGFEMWASFRYNFFHEKSKKVVDDPITDFTFKIDPFGLYIAKTCDAKLSQYAKDTFAEVYLGCIH